MLDFEFYTPENLNLKELAPDLPEAEYDKLNYLIHLIYEQRAVRKIKTDFIPLKALYLRKVLRDHTWYRETLERIGVIECDYHYITGSKSYGYRLTKKYRNIDCCVIKCKNKRVNNHLLKQITNDDTAKLAEHLYLKNQLSKLQISDDLAKIEIKDFETEKKNSAIIAIHKIKSKNWHIKCDEFGRLHSNLTILSKSLRKFLTVNNKPLINVDIVNSQPVFLLCFCLKKENIYNIIPSRCAAFYESDELKLYSELVQAGEFYQFLTSVYNVKSREDVKELIFKDFFGPNFSFEFSTAFPELTRILKELKRKDYRNVSHLLQTQESQFVISNVCGKLSKLISADGFVGTIHDSILTTAEHVDLVTNTVMNEFAVLNIKPTLNVGPA